MVTAQAIGLVVITHWDDDHIRGIADVVKASGNAVVACSAAIARRDVVQFILEQESGELGVGSGVDELRSVLRLCANTGRLVWAKANTILYPLPPSEELTVIALSPSDDAITRSITELIEAATQESRAVRTRFTAPEGPNGSSVVTAIERGDVRVLLGADLERSNNPEAGWDAVIKYARRPKSGSAAKIPHHGSEGADHEGMWNELLDADPLAIVTPFIGGSTKLPTEPDIERICSNAGTAYLTAMPVLRKAKLDHTVAKLVKRFHGGDVDELHGWGHVRARRSIDGAVWSVDVDGDAVELNP